MTEKNTTTPPADTNTSILDHRYQHAGSEDLFIEINDNLTTLRAIMNSEDLFDMTGTGLSNFIAHTQDLVNLAEQRFHGG